MDPRSCLRHSARGGRQNEINRQHGSRTDRIRGVGWLERNRNEDNDETRGAGAPPLPLRRDPDDRLCRLCRSGGRSAGLHDEGSGAVHRGGGRRTARGPLRLESDREKLLSVPPRRRGPHRRDDPLRRQARGLRRDDGEDRRARGELCLRSFGGQGEPLRVQRGRGRLREIRRERDAGRGDPDRVDHADRRRRGDDPHQLFPERRGGGLDLHGRRIRADRLRRRDDPHEGPRPHLLRALGAAQHQELL